MRMLALGLLVLASTAAQARMPISYGAQLIGERPFRIVVAPEEAGLALSVFVPPDQELKLRYRIFQASGTLGAPVADGEITQPAGTLERAIAVPLPFAGAEETLRFRILLEGRDGAALATLDVTRIGQQVISNTVRTIQDSRVSIGLIAPSDHVQAILERHGIPFHQVGPSTPKSQLTVTETPAPSADKLSNEARRQSMADLMYLPEDVAPVALAKASLVLTHPPSQPTKNIAAEIALLQMIQSQILTITQKTP